MLNFMVLKLRARWMTVLATAAAINSAHAAGGPPADFGLGLMVGSITAMTGKYHIDSRGAVAFGIGFGDPGTAIYADYLYHVPGMFGTGTKFGRETSGYFGGGAGIGFWDDDYECGRWHCDRRRRDDATGVFIRGLFGFEWYAKPTRFGVFAELGPTILLAPDSGSGLDVGVGGRWYF